MSYIYIHDMIYIYIYISYVTCVTSAPLLSLDINPMQHNNNWAPAPMKLTDSGMLMEVNEMQLSKARAKRRVTEDGSVIRSNEEQPAKAQPPMTRTELGMFTWGLDGWKRQKYRIDI